MCSAGSSPAATIRWTGASRSLTASGSWSTTRLVPQNVAPVRSIKVRAGGPGCRAPPNRRPRSPARGAELVGPQPQPPRAPAVVGCGGFHERVAREQGVVLADRDEAGPEPERHGPAEQEAAGLDADDVGDAGGDERRREPVDDRREIDAGLEQPPHVGVAVEPAEPRRDDGASASPRLVGRAGHGVSRRRGRRRSRRTARRSGRCRPRCAAPRASTAPRRRAS